MTGLDFSRFPEKIRGLVANRLIQLAVVLILVIGVGAGVYLVQQKQIFRSKAAGSTPAFSFSPSSRTDLSIGMTFPVTLRLNTNGNNVSGVKVITSFTNTVLQADSFTPSNSWFDTKVIPGKFLASGINNTSGTVEYVAVQVENSPVIGDVELGTINFRVVGSGTATVSINGFGYQIVAVGQSGTVTADVTATGTYSFPNPTNAPTPTTAPEPTSTPVPGNPFINSPSGGAKIEITGTDRGSVPTVRWNNMLNAQGGIHLTGVRIMAADTLTSSMSLDCPGGDGNPVYVDRWWYESTDNTNYGNLVPPCNIPVGRTLSAVSPNGSPTDYSPQEKPLAPGRYFLAVLQYDNDGYRCSNGCTLEDQNRPNEMAAYRTTYFIDVSCPAGKVWNGTFCDLAPTGSPTPTLTPTSTPGVAGDVDQNGCVERADIDIWEDEYYHEITTSLSDVTGDGKVDLVDLNLIRNNLGKGWSCRL